jgi:CRP-like cAMP-binding protein
VPVFSTLPEPALAALVAVAERRQIAVGRPVSGTDESGLCAVIVDGGVEIQRRSAAQPAAPRLGPGAVIGELALLTAGSRTPRAVATAPTTAVVVTRQGLEQAVVAHPPLGLHLTGRLAQRLRQAETRIAALSVRRASTRVVQVLLDILRERGEPDPDGTGLRVRGRLTHRDLAQRAATSRETASRVMARLARDGIVSSRRGRLTVHRPDELVPAAATTASATR